MKDVLFLPGGIAPAEVRYRPFLNYLPGISPLLKDLEVYAGEAPPTGYSVQTEVDGIAGAADRAGWDRFHIYAHSGGAACALAFVASHPERVLSLAVDEPASDFTPADRADPYWTEIDDAVKVPGPRSVAAFLQLQVAPGVELSGPPDGPPPAWMAKRPAGMAALANALRNHRVDPASYSKFDGPVLFTFGSLTHPRWQVMRDRLKGLFRDFTSEEFEGLHHLNTCHQAEPARTAELVTKLWGRAQPQ